MFHLSNYYIYFPLSCKLLVTLLLFFIDESYNQMPHNYKNVMYNAEGKGSDIIQMIDSGLDYDGDS